MTERIILSIVLAMMAPVLIIGAVEWSRGRGSLLLMMGLPTTALVIGNLPGEGHPVWRYTFLTISLGIVGFNLIRFRKKIPWRGLKLTLLFCASTMALVAITEIFVDLATGTPRWIKIVLVFATAASFALFVASMFWDFRRVFLRYRASRLQ